MGKRKRFLLIIAGLVSIDFAAAYLAYRYKIKHEILLEDECRLRADNSVLTRNECPINCLARTRTWIIQIFKERNTALAKVESLNNNQIG